MTIALGPCNMVPHFSFELKYTFFHEYSSCVFVPEINVPVYRKRQVPEVYKRYKKGLWNCI